MKALWNYKNWKIADKYFILNNMFGNIPYVINPQSHKTKTVVSNFEVHYDIDDRQFVYFLWNGRIYKVTNDDYEIKHFSLPKDIWGESKGRFSRVLRWFMDKHKHNYILNFILFSHAVGLREDGNNVGILTSINVGYEIPHLNKKIYYGRIKTWFLVKYLKYKIREDQDVNKYYCI